MTFYMGITILTELLMIAMTIHVLNYTGFTRRQKEWFILTFASIIFCSAAEFAVHCGVYDYAYAKLLTILTVLQFSLAPLLAVCFTGALGLPNQKKPAVVFFLLNFVMEAAAAPFSFIFGFNREGYFRGSGFFLYEISYVLSLIYLIFGIHSVSRQFRHRDRWTIIMILVILSAGIIPMTFFHINITYIAIALAASLCYIYYNDLVQQDIQEDLITNQKKLSDMQVHIISGLANLIERRDTETGEHITRTSQYVKMLAEFARSEGVYTEELTDSFIELLYTLSPMHDIGKILVSDTILKKPGRLTREEFEELKRHASEGGRAVKDVLNDISEEEYISFASDIAKYHHEWWDGTGYPEGRKGEEIPLSARIMAVADVYDALISKRCYKDAYTSEEAFRIIEEESGTHFDPNLVRVFLHHKKEFTPDKE